MRTRLNIPANEIRTGDIVDLEEVTKVYRAFGSVLWATEESGWMMQAVSPEFRVNVHR